VDVQPGDVIERDGGTGPVLAAPYGGGDGETRSKDRGQDGARQ